MPSKKRMEEKKTLIQKLADSKLKKPTEDDTKNIKRGTLDVVYCSFQAATNEDTMKLALFYFLTLELLSNAKSTLVFDMCFRIVKSLEAINDYPWGSYIWPDLKGQMK
ncbi:hypothetical protein PanWU01x14_265140 [Parasponia andersonii]|uniref:DUF1985 domain-containing protein n=1 Tax=Parasponia andersonii TaxID=3476 RepID=A0A2P5B758_PARAD|nr:hypothetical protein PanWU01x14_265140 [Parasponia andersonii]